jgi:hypothetical protein
VSIGLRAPPLPNRISAPSPPRFSPKISSPLSLRLTRFLAIDYLLRKLSIGLGTIVFRVVFEDGLVGDRRLGKPDARFNHYVEDFIPK